MMSDINILFRWLFSLLGGAVAEHINAAINANRQAKAEIDWQVYNPENSGER